MPKKILVLGGTAMLGHELARTALTRGHEVACVARGDDVPEGATLFRADRDRDDALASIADQPWDAVYDVSRQPGQVKRAVRDLAHAGVYVFVSTCNVYAAQNEPGADESAELLEPLDADTENPEDYGPRKVACEQHVLAAFEPSRSLIARSGLIGGPGDTSTRSGYWPMRFAVSDTVLVPDDAALPTQLVDVRDLAGWLVDAAENESIRGVANVAGDPIPLGDHLATARGVAGHHGRVVAASREWLVEHGVAEFAGPRSMPLWLSDSDWLAFMDRSNVRAKHLGLRLRPLEHTLADVLEWERTEGLDRPRKAGMTTAEQNELVALLTSSSG
ncbi:MAG: NAD-dependent epimerase/dehydratase family protein [Actinomycetota bacterium]